MLWAPWSYQKSGACGLGIMAPRVHIAGYELLDRLGAGAESMIFRARHIASDRIVAIKHVSVEGRENEKYLRHALNEYRTLRALTTASASLSPNGIVKVYRLIRTPLLWRMRRRKRLSIVMQYVEGMDLRRERRYPIAQIIDIMLQVAKSLSQLHARGIIHGDLKPENIIVGPAGRATLVDFGFSCKAGSPATSIRGTRDYMAPEQVNMGHLSGKTDIYNFGATLYFLLTGRHVPALIPAVGDPSHFIASRDINPMSPRSLNENVPPVLAHIVLRCVKREVIERPACIEEVIDVLAEARSGFLGSGSAD